MRGYLKACYYELRCSPKPAGIGSVRRLPWLSEIVIVALN